MFKTRSIPNASVHAIAVFEEIGKKKNEVAQVCVKCAMIETFKPRNS